MIPSLPLSTISSAADLVRAATPEPRAAGRASSPARPAASPTTAGSAAACAAAAGLTLARPASHARGRAAIRTSSGAGYAGAASSPAKAPSPNASEAKATSQSSASDPLAFLRDSKLSVEEKLMRLLAHLNAQWEKDMQKKLEAFRDPSDAPASKGGDAGSGASGTSGAAGKGGTNGRSVLEAVAGAARSFLPAVGFALDALKSPAVREAVAKIGGPVLAAAATAMGFPTLAPAILACTPKVLEVAGGIASAFDGVGKAAARSAPDPEGSGSPAPAGTKAAGDGGTRAGKASSGSKMSASEQQLALMEIQQLREKQKEMFGIVSNVLKSGHDLRMGVIANLR